MDDGRTACRRIHLRDISAERPGRRFGGVGMRRGHGASFRRQDCNSFFGQFLFFWLGFGERCSFMFGYKASCPSTCISGIRSLRGACRCHDPCVRWGLKSTSLLSSRHLTLKDIDINHASPWTRSESVPAGVSEQEGEQVDRFATNSCLPIGAPWCLYQSTRTGKQSKEPFSS